MGLNISPPANPLFSYVETGAGAAIGTGVVILQYDTEIADPGSRITTGAAWKYTAVNNCTIKLNGSVRFTTAVRRMDVYIDGSAYKRVVEMGTVDLTVSISITFSLNAAQYFDLRANSGGASALYGDATFNFLTIEEIPR